MFILHAPQVQHDVEKGLRMPAPTLSALLAPASTAVLTMELQRGVAGDLSFIPALAEAVADTGAATAAGKVCALARSAGAMVVHCTLEQRPGAVGYRKNARMLGMWARQRSPQGQLACEHGSPEADLMPELGVQPTDVIVPRHSGVTPFAPSALDTLLRNSDISTVVATGVSVNMGIPGLAMEAVNLGYDVVVVREAVAGFPAEYAAQVMDNSLALLTTIVTLSDLQQEWGSRR
jgi:nicotinamidase-related amidase